MSKKPENEPWWEQGPVLDGHKRKKKRLVPPLMDFPQSHFVSTLDQIFPELFWMCLIFQENGPHLSTRTIIPVLKSLYELDPKTKWYRTSVMLSNRVRLQDISNPTLTNEIDRIIKAIDIIEEVYIVSVRPSLASGDLEARVSFIEQTVEAHWDRGEPEYCSVLATCLVALGVAGAGEFPPDLLKHVNKIIEDPESDDAQSTMSMLRAASNAMFPMEEDALSKMWCRRFWNVNGQISDCRWER